MKGLECQCLLEALPRLTAIVPRVPSLDGRGRDAAGGEHGGGGGHGGLGVGPHEPPLCYSGEVPPGLADALPDAQS